MNKQIFFTSPGRAELLDKEMPICGDDEVIVRIERSTISSGTERANLVGNPNVNPGGVGKVKFPRSLGYSTAGVVTEVGSAITSLKVGDRVITAKYTGTEVKIDDVEYTIVRQEDILAIVE